jgi:hypothetical protein
MLSDGSFRLFREVGRDFIGPAFHLRPFESLSVIRQLDHQLAAAHDNDHVTGEKAGIALELYFAQIGTEADGCHLAQPPGPES